MTRYNLAEWGLRRPALTAYLIGLILLTGTVAFLSLGQTDMPLGLARGIAGDRLLILANAGYAVGKHDFAAPLLNGFMYESGWSHGRTEWDVAIAALRRSEGLLREPRISVIERFEDTGRRAGWPGDPGRGQPGLDQLPWPPGTPAGSRSAM